jgi:hypothetical protein
MLKRNLIALTLVVASFNIKGQDLFIDLKKETVKIDNIDSLKKDIYNLLADYRVILIGEIHGTNEPANLVKGLVALFTKNGDSVQVGFEIPSNQMANFKKLKSNKSILTSEFFVNPSGDGRASEAWFKSIVEIKRNRKAEVFFYGEDIDQSEHADSFMYLNIKAKIKEHPQWKTITIGGGIHNRVLPYNGKITFGTLLTLDKELNFANSVCSLNHVFEQGETLWNKFEPMPTIYTKLPFDHYLFLFPNSIKEPYNGIYYTKYVTKSVSAVSR